LLPEYGADKAWHGSAHIRLLRPLEHPEVFGGRALFDVQRELPRSLRADVVIVERNWRPDVDLRLAEALIGAVRRVGAKLWWAIDDNLLDTHPVQQTELGLRHLRPVGRLFAREADAVLVSTQSLADRLGKICRRCVVLPNLLDERLFPELPQPEAQASIERIGYLGTFTHGPDLASILPALAEAMSLHPGWRFELLGVTPSLARIPAAVANRMDVLDGFPAPYTEFLPWVAKNLCWSIGVAPLLPGAFNDCKSDIKLLDLAVIGSAAVCADVPAYATSATKAGAWLAEAGDTESWLRALLPLMGDRDLRIQYARRLREYLINERTLRSAGHIWREALLRLF
jgi:hypothetical protein